jgi:predicted transcriptional regulator
MLRTSLPIGRIFDVDIRVHVSFPLLLVVAVGYSVVLTGGAARGVGLWLALCLAVFVRECARVIAAAYAGLRPRAIYLLPIGGLMAFSTQDGAPPAGDGHEAATRLLAWTGPIANIAAGVLLLGACYALVPEVNLLAQPWISTGHLLRSTIWTQVVLGVVSLLPLPSLRAPVTAAADEASHEATGEPAATTLSALRLPRKLPNMGLGTALALGMILSGAILLNLWLVLLGGFMMLGARLSTIHKQATAAGAESILVRDVMLTEYTLLSSSDTLQGALDRTVHSLQDVFPVVRGDRLVGSVARSTIHSSLVSAGDSYLQGIMTRSLQLAAPADKVGDALRKAAAVGASEFIPVVEDDTMIGILTPQSLSRAVQHIKITRTRPGRRDS